MLGRLTGITMGVGVALALASCGGTAAPSSSASGTETAGIEAHDFQFSPTTLTLPANATVNLTVKNNGTVHHNFSIKELGVNKDVETPGKSETVSFTTKGDATYTYFCEYHGASKGMKGTLTVGAGGAPAAAPANSPSAPAAPSPSSSYRPY